MAREVTTGLLQPFGWGLGYPDWSDPDPPAAGANYTRIVGGMHSERVLGAMCTVSTDSNAANRFVSLDFLNARGTTYMRNAAAVVLTASTSSQVFVWSSARANSEWNTNTPVLAPLQLCFLPPAFKIQITIDNIQAGDTITGVHLWLEKWPTGPRGLPFGETTEAELVGRHELG